MAQVANPAHVVADELIESAWGNSVVDAIGNVASLWQPAGASGSIADRLYMLNQSVAAFTYQRGTMAKLAGQGIVSTDASGNARIYYGATFTAAPIVVCTPVSDDQAWTVIARWDWIDATSFNVKVWRGDGSVAPAGNALRVNWIAVGTLA